MNNPLFAYFVVIDLIFYKCSSEYKADGKLYKNKIQNSKYQLCSTVDTQLNVLDESISNSPMNVSISNMNVSNSQININELEISKNIPLPDGMSKV